MSAPIEDRKEAAIGKAYVPNDEEHKWRKHVYQRKSDMAQARSKYEPLWDRQEQQWEALRPPKKNWQANITPPFTTSVIESQLSELIDQFLKPKASPRGPEDKSRALVMNKIVDYTLDVGDGDIEYYKAIKDGLIHGTGIVQEYYWRDARQVRTLVEYDPIKGVEKYEEKEITDFDDVYMEAIKLTDFYIDENARSINRGPYKANDCIRRYVMSLEKFQDIYKGPIWDPKDRAKYVVAGGDTNYYEFFTPPMGLPKDNVEILWYWSRTPDMLVIVANDVVIRVGPNPYNHKQLPFAQAIDVVRPHQFYHKGEPELLESIQEELNTIRRQRLDRVHLDIDKMFIVSNRDVLIDQDLIAAPHKPIFVDDPSSIRPLEYASTPQSAYMEEDRLKEDGERVTGMSVNSQGVAASGSATEAAILKETTSRRLKMKIWILARTLYTEQTRLRIANITQYYQTPKLEAILGKDAGDLEQGIIAGDVTKIGDKSYRKLPRTIKTRNVELKREGQLVTSKEKRGTNFFDVIPEDVMPSRGGFDLEISAEPIFPVSKPLLQQKTNELFQHPVIQMGIQTGVIDLKKSASKLFEVNDFEPEDFEPAAQGEASIDPQTMIAMANEENAMMLEGKAIGGTAYAPREHTEIHLEFLKSPDFTAAFRQNPQVLGIFKRHIYQEEAAQIDRMGAQPGAPEGQQPAEGTPGNVAAGVMASEAQAANGARAVGDTGMNAGTGNPNAG